MLLLVLVNFSCTSKPKNFNDLLYKLAEIEENQRQKLENWRNATGKKIGQKFAYGTYFGRDFLERIGQTGPLTELHQRLNVVLHGEGRTAAGGRRHDRQDSAEGARRGHS